MMSTKVMSALTALSRPVPLLLLVVAGVALDQAIKWAVEAFLPLRQVVPVAPMLALFRTYNEGIAFSFLTGTNVWALLALTGGILVFVLYLWRRTPPARGLSHLGFALIIAGAAGNLIDRARLGHVVDYILFYTAGWSFAVFNLADSFITLGAVAIVVDELIALRSGHRGGGKR